MKIKLTGRVGSVNDIVDDIDKLSDVINYPSAEGLLTAVKTFPKRSPPPGIMQAGRQERVI